MLPASPPPSLAARLDHILIGDFIIGRRTRRYASLLLLVIAVLLGLGTYHTSGWLSSRSVSLRPTMISGLAAVTMIAALYVRRVIEFSPSLYSLLSVALNVTVTAILVEAILNSRGGSMFGRITGLAMPHIIVIALILTWIGLRPLAPMVWVLVVLIGLANLRTASAAMGLWGYLFILTAAAGVLLQLEPSRQNLGSELLYSLKGSPVEAVHQIASEKTS